MKKVITVLILSIILICSMSVSVFAMDAESGEASLSVDTNIFDTVYEILLENCDKILSALAFIASLILIFVYKKGLLPILKGALASLGASVSSLKDETGRINEKSSEKIELATQKLENAEQIISSLGDKLAQLEVKLESTEELKLSAQAMRTIMDSQVDMLYNIFMSSSLPAYQKEAVGTKITEMRKLLSPNAPVTSEVKNDADTVG